MLSDYFTAMADNFVITLDPAHSTTLPSPSASNSFVESVRWLDWAKNGVGLVKSVVTSTMIAVAAVASPCEAVGTALARPGETSDSFTLQSQLAAVVEVDSGALLDENCTESEIDCAMAEAQRRIRQSDWHFASRLLDMAFNVNGPAHARRIALETLAGARVPTLAGLVSLAIAECLTSGDPELRFTAVAAAANLSRDRRTALTDAIRTLATEVEPDANVRAAAAAFLRAVAA